MTTETTTRSTPTIVVFGSAVTLPGSCHDIDVIYSGCTIDYARAAVATWARHWGVCRDREMPPIDFHPELAAVGEDGIVTVTIPYPKWVGERRIKVLAGEPAIVQVPKDGLAARIRAYADISLTVEGTYSVGLDPAGEDGYDGDGAVALGNAAAHLRRSGDFAVETLERKVPGLLAVVDAIAAGVASVPLAAAVAGGGAPSKGSLIIDCDSATGALSRRVTMPLYRMSRVLRGEAVNSIVAVGSVDGIMTTAALVVALQARGEMARVHWTQAHEVDKVQVEPGTDLWLVDLAVDQRVPARTASWLRCMVGDRAATLRGIIDEHGAHAWALCLDAVLRDLQGTIDIDLEIEPQDMTSAGAVLRGRLDGWYRGSHTLFERAMALAMEADLADRGDFCGGTRRVVNAAVKADLKDAVMRYMLVNWLAAGDLAVVPEPIASAAASYEADVARQTASLDAAVVAEDGAVDIAAHHIRDITSLAFSAYRAWPGHVLAIHTDERVLFCEQVQRHGGAQSVIDRLVAAGIPHAGIAGRVGILRSDYSEEVRRIALGLPRWRLAPAPGVTLPEDMLALRFSSRAQAWRAADGLLGGGGEAVEGPHGVAALVSVVQE